MKLISKKGFGVNEIVAIAAGLAIAVLIVVPGMSRFAKNVMESIGDWWNGMAGTLFNNIN